MSDEMSEVEALREKLAESEKRHGEYIAARLRLWEAERAALRADLADALAALKPFANDARVFYEDEASYPDGSAVAASVDDIRFARAVYDRLSAGGSVSEA